MSRSEFKPWNYETKFRPNTHIKRRYIDVKDNVVFSNHRDALRCFGYEGGHYQRAVWAIKGTDKEVWFPKLYKNEGWDNSLSDDFKTIIMEKADKTAYRDPHELEWIVFAHYKDLLGQVVYKFLGEFHLSLEKSSNFKWVFIIKKSKIYFDNL